MQPRGHMLLEHSTCRDGKDKRIWSDVVYMVGTTSVSTLTWPNLGSKKEKTPSSASIVLDREASISEVFQGESELPKTLGIKACFSELIERKAQLPKLSQCHSSTLQCICGKARILQLLKSPPRSRKRPKVALYIL